jgi:hypothetical protein
MTRPDTMDMPHLKFKGKKLQVGGLGFGWPALLPTVDANSGGCAVAHVQAEAMRQQEIQQDNMQLLQRMHAIMSMGEDTPATEFAPGVRLTKTQVRGALQRWPPGPSPT